MNCTVYGEVVGKSVYGGYGVEIWEQVLTSDEYAILE